MFSTKERQPARMRSKNMVGVPNQCRGASLAQAGRRLHPTHRVQLLYNLAIFSYSLLGVQADSVTEMLTRSLSNCPLCAPKEGCLTSCKAEGLGWRSCLDRCLGDNPMMLDMFTHMTEKLEGRKKPQPEGVKQSEVPEETGAASVGDNKTDALAGVRVALAGIGASQAAGLPRDGMIVKSMSTSPLRGFGKEL
ncbi:unnamed protein product [Amoebophrya sp. A25]|nr:unnamed protein product [Amoebophrya sp. A25]|eukprot:GSA25T00017469001.1